MNENALAEVLSDSIKQQAKQTGSDYTATVTKVEGSTAYVQLAGSDIADTPVALSIAAKVGDKVRVRVANGKAWITGNDTEPPAGKSKIEQVIEESTVAKRVSSAEGKYSEIKQSVDGIKLEVGNKMASDMSNRASSISIDSGQIAFNANSLVVDSDNFKLDEQGNAEFSGTVKGATYEDSTSHFKMDIGSHLNGDSVTPAFKLGGYLNGDSSNEYLELEITILPIIGSLPQLSIAANSKSSPTGSANASVSLNISDTGASFYGSWGGNTVHSSLPWGYNP